MAELATLQLVQLIGVRSTMGGPINQEVGAPPLLGFPHTMLNVKKVTIICNWLSLKSSSLTAKSGLLCKQDTCASRVCHTRVKATCVT
jgi:hypothetical protein